MSEKQADTLLNVPEIIRQTKITSNLKRDSELTSHLGVVRAALSNWCARNSIDFPLLLSKLHHAGYNWLLTGEGSPLHGPKSFDNEKVQGEVETIHNSKTTEAIDDRSVTLYDTTVTANLKTLLSGKRQYALDKILVPSIPACGGTIFVSRDSIYPILKSGNIVGFKGINSFSNVICGEMYIVAFRLDGDQYLTVKYINHSKKEGYVKLISYNPHHEPMDLPVDTVQGMAIVKFSVRRSMMI